jgi:galactokinase
MVTGEISGPPREVTEEAPGRANLIGEHTDSSGGFVLPVTIPERTSGAATAGGPWPGCTWCSREPRSTRSAASTPSRLADCGEPPLADLEDLPEAQRLPVPLDRRARHVVTEDARVLEAVAALRGGELERLGALLAASHRSTPLSMYEQRAPFSPPSLCVSP